MKSTKRLLGWLCIFSTLLMGCCSSNSVYRSEDFRERIQSGSIEYVVTWDGKKHVFDSTPDIANDFIVGNVDGKSVSIPISDVVRVSMKEINWALTIAIGVSALVVAAIVIAAVYADAADKAFDNISFD